MTAEQSMWDPSRLSVFEGGETLMAFGAGGTIAPGGQSATFGGEHSRAARWPTAFTVNGRYQVLESLGEGGMGVVYRVADLLHPERALALKTIQSAILTPERVNMFKAEFRTMAELRHPNVATVFDFEPMASGGDYMFTMEFVRGMNLFEATARAGHERIVEFLVQVCRALGYLHCRGIVHFDLKPANVLVNGEGTVKVLDFGLVGSDRRGGLIGTPTYMAPELVGGGAVDHRADLYSLGIMLYELLCRRPPFVASTLFSLLNKHAVEPLHFSADDSKAIPEWLQQIVRRLCAKEPAERFRTANAVIEELNRSSPYAYQVETAATKESYILSSRFVGRSSEADKVVAHLAARTAGAAIPERVALMIGGPSGLGKTRLIREVRRQAQLSGLSFVDAECTQDGTEIGEVLSHAARLALGVGAVELLERFGHDLSALGARLERDLPVAPAEVDESVHRAGAAAFVVAIAQRAPFVISLDDLQRAGAGTVALVAEIIATVKRIECGGQRVRLGIIGTYRDDEISGRPLQLALERWRSDGVLEALSLAPLASEHVGRLLASMLGLDTLPERFVERVNVEAAGNPFFVAELMRGLVENGTVYIEDGLWATATDIATLEIPTSISQVFARRLSLLDEESRRVLVALAVLGRPTEVALIQGMSGLDSDTTYRALSNLVARQMIEGLPGEVNRYRIAHDRLRETIYAQLDAAQSTSLHRQAALAIEQLYAAEIDLHIHALAFHFWQAGERERALEHGLVGRKRQMALLRERWAHARAGRGAVVLLEGESGMGKTRLAREAVKLAQRAGALVIMGKAQPGDERPYAALRDGLAQYVSSLRTLPMPEAARHHAALTRAAAPVAAIIRSFSPALTPFLEGEASTKRLEPEAEQERFRAAIVTFLAALGQQHGAMLLVMDDVQWLDDSTSNILNRLGPKLAHAAVLLLATARSDEDSRAGRARFVEALGDNIVESVAVEPLDNRAMARLVEVQLPGGRLDETLFADLATRSRGNPFVLGQYLRWLEDEHIIVLERGEWRKSGDRAELPADIADVLVRRAARLGGEAEQALTLAAVHGFAFDHELVVIAMGDRARGERGIDEALRANLIEPSHNLGSYVFVHDRVREAFLLRASAEQRAHAHGQLADAITALGGAEDDDVYALARHHAASARGDAAAVHRSSFRAGRLAFDHNAFTDAYDFLARADAAARQAGIAATADFEELLGQSCVFTYRVAEALTHFERGVALARSPVQAAAFQSRCAMIYFFKKDYAGSWRALEACTSLLGVSVPRGRPLGLVRAIGRWVFSKICDRFGWRPQWGQGDEPQRRLEVLTDAFQCALLLNYYHTANVPGIVEAGLNLYYFATLLRPGASQLLAYAIYGSLAGFLQGKGELDHMTKRCLEMGQQMGDAPSLGRAMYYCGFGNFVCGYGQESHAMMRRAIVEYGHAMEKHVLLATFMKHLSFLDMQGYSKEVVEMSDLAIGHCRVLGDELTRPWLTMYHALRAAALAELGRDEECNAQLRLLGERFAGDSLPLESLQIRYAGRIQTVLARGELGAPLDVLIEEFEAKRLPLFNTVIQAMNVYIYRGYARLAQYEERRAGDRAAERKRLQAAIRVLLVGVLFGICRTHRHILRAGMLISDGKFGPARSALTSAEALATKSGSRRALLEVARLRATLARAAGDAATADSELAKAIQLADEAGWGPRAARLRLSLANSLAKNALN